MAADEKQPSLERDLEFVHDGEAGVVFVQFTGQAFLGQNFVGHRFTCFPARGVLLDRQSGRVEQCGWD